MTLPIDIARRMAAEHETVAPIKKRIESGKMDMHPRVLRYLEVIESMSKMVAQELMPDVCLAAFMTGYVTALQHQGVEEDDIDPAAMAQKIGDAFAQDMPDMAALIPDGPVSKIAALLDL